MENDFSNFEKNKDWIDVTNTILQREGKILHLPKRANEKLTVECKKGHVFYPLKSNLLKGHWCFHCAGLTKVGIDKVRKIVESKGGTLLTKEYKNKDTHVDVQCVCGHQWKITTRNLQKGRWCSECSNYVGEHVCRKVFEKLFNKEFPKTRPAWLINKSGNKLELDGFCKELNLAFEYQGYQHSKDYKKRFFLHTQKDKNRLLGHDLLKRKICKEKNIILVEIPYQLNLQNIFNLVLTKCRNSGIALPEEAERLTLTDIEIYRPHELQFLQKLARSRGGTLLSKQYLNAYTKLEWQCANNHKWAAASNAIKSGTWCPYCVNKGPTSKLKIELFQEIAKNKGGECITKKYVNQKTKLIFKCKERHIWSGLPSHIKRGVWCRKCHFKNKHPRHTINKFKNIAESKGGKCLSEEYKDVDTKLVFECGQGHRWFMLPTSALQKWCPSCTREQKSELRQNKWLIFFQKLAKEKGGKLLSQQYFNSQTRLQFKCVNGHNWSAFPTHISRGSWCAKCHHQLIRAPKLNIHIFQEIARKRGGRCLSKQYLGSKIKLTFECAKKHTWSAVQYNIRTKGQWCAKCASSN